MSTRAARVPTAPIETRLGSAFGRLANVSATGALVRTGTPLEAGRYCPMIVNLPDSPTSMSVRIVRSERAPERPGRLEASPQYLVAVRFTELSAAAKHALASLCRTGRSQRE